MFGSPCIDSGDNTVLSLDLYDVDEDGDVNELLPFDLDGSFRTWPLNGITDRGAYEYVENGLLAQYSNNIELLEGPILD